MWTVRVIWHIWCWKRPKTPNNTNKTTSESRAGNCSLCHSVFSTIVQLDWITQDAWVCEQCGWFDIYDVETGVKHPTIQTKRPLKSWWAMAPFSTLCSVLTHSWVDSPRSHEFVNCESDWTYMLLKTVSYKPQQCNHIHLWKHDEQWLLIKTLFSVLSRRWVDSPRKHVCVCVCVCVWAVRCM